MFNQNVIVCVVFKVGHNHVHIFVVLCLCETCCSEIAMYTVMYGGCMCTVSFFHHIKER